MSALKQQIRTNQALQVIQHGNSGMSIVVACQEVGIPRSTFYYFIGHNPDAIASFQDMQMVAALEQFGLILANQTEILEHVIQEGLAENTKPRQRLAIYKEITKRADELMGLIQASHTSDTDVSDILSGPTLIPGESRFASASTPIALGSMTGMTSGSGTG
jgi:ACT domain-containing protein